jgi:hypothetical protein
MDVTGFLCVSLGSSTVQLRNSLDSRRARAYSEAGFSSQNDDRAWGCTAEEQRSVVRFLWAKGLNAKDIHKEMFPVCRVKRFTTGWQMFRWWRRGWNGGAEVAETTVKRLLCCGFRRTGKAMEQVYRCWWLCREINVFFQVQISHVLYQFATSLPTFPRNVENMRLMIFAHLENYRWLLGNLQVCSTDHSWLLSIKLKNAHTP